MAERLPAHPLAQPELERLAQRDAQAALAEDVGDGDLLGHLLEPDMPARARIMTRAACVLAGRPWAEAALAACCGEEEVTSSWLGQDGDEFAADSMICAITAPAMGLLEAERTMLNFLQLLSGTATAARSLAKAAGDTPVYDTRKTIPGLRAAQRYATQTGGMRNNRFGLFDAAIIKENHIEATGSVRRALEQAFTRLEPEQVQIEVVDVKQLREALDAGAVRIMLDNWEVDAIKEAVEIAGGRAELEATGGIDADNAGAYAATGVQRLSASAPTKSAQAIDMTMIFEG